MDGRDRLDALLTEYEQTGEEYRTRHRLLHNSYYLFVISLLLFAGALIPRLGKPIEMGALLLVGCLASFVLGFAILTHFVERRSAAVLRTRMEQEIEEIANDDIEFNREIQRPLSIQYHVIGQNVEMDDSQDIVVYEDDFEVILDLVWSRPDFSAKTLAQGILLLSLVQAIGGIAYLTASFL